MICLRDTAFRIEFGFAEETTRFSFEAFSFSNVAVTTVPSAVPLASLTLYVRLYGALLPVRVRSSLLLIFAPLIVMLLMPLVGELSDPAGVAEAVTVSSPRTMTITRMSAIVFFAFMLVLLLYKFLLPILI